VADPLDVVSGLDSAAVMRGVAVTLAILIPPVIIVRAYLGSRSDSPVLYAVLLAFLASFPAGGAAAASRAPSSRMTNAAVTGGLAFGVAFAASVARNVVTGRSMSLAGVLFAAVLSSIAVTLAMTGGFLAGRRNQGSVAR